jgi:hypothetical protein
MPIIPGIVASEASAHLQPQPPFIDTISGAVVISGGTTSGSNSIVQVYLTPNPLGHPLTSYGVTAFSGTPLVAVSGATVTGTTSPLTITYPFAANGLYQFAGYARNNYGNSNYGNQSNQVEPFLATATPSGLAVSGTSVSGVQFTFLQIPGSTNYILSAAGSFTDNAGLTTVDNFAVNVAGPGTSPTVTGVMNHGFFTGMPYKFYVQSQNFAGTSASGANIILTPNPFAAPTVAPIFTATPSGNNNFINVTITNPDTNPLHNLPNGYYYVDTNNGFSSTKILANTVTLSGLTNPIEPVAIVNVTAIGSYGETPGTPQTLLFPPATPTSIVATVTTSGSGFNAQSATATVAVSWTASVANKQYSAPTNYIITASAAGYPSISTSGSTTSANLTGSFNVNTNYTVTVTASNAGGSAIGTAPSTVQPYTVVVPGAVTGVTGGAAGTGEMDYQWTPPATGGPYSNILLYTSPATTTQVVASGTSTAQFTYSFAKGTSYTFYAVPTNAAGSSAPVSSVTATPYPGFVPITVYAVGAGGGGGWYTGGAAGNIVNGGSAQATRGQTISCVIGAGGTATAASTATAGTGGNSGATDGGVSVVVIGYGGNGGGPGTTSNRGTGGSNNSWSGGTGVAGAGGGGAGSNGNGSAGTGTAGGNGGPATNLGSFGSYGPYVLAGGGGGRGTGTQGNTPSQYLPGTGGYSETVGQNGLVIIRWALLDYPGTPTYTGSPSTTSDTTYGYAIYTSTGSITFN